MKILSVIGNICSSVLNNIKNLFACKKVKTIKATVNINRDSKSQRKGSVKNKKAKK